MNKGEKKEADDERFSWCFSLWGACILLLGRKLLNSWRRVWCLWCLRIIEREPVAWLKKKPEADHIHCLSSLATLWAVWKPWFGFRYWLNGPLEPLVRSQFSDYPSICQGLSSRTTIVCHHFWEIANFTEYRFIDSWSLLVEILRSTKNFVSVTRVYPYVSPLPFPPLLMLKKCEC